MSERGLSNFVAVLIRAAESDFSRVKHETSTAALVDVVCMDRNLGSLRRISRVFEEIELSLRSARSISSSSVAWLEMLLVEVSLRNRDRFGVIWPLLIRHYTETLDDFHSLTYVAERCSGFFSVSHYRQMTVYVCRRVVGLMKIAARMISRDQFSASVVELLAKLFVGRAADPSLVSCSPKLSASSTPSVSACLSDQVTSHLCCFHCCSDSQSPTPAGRSRYVGAADAECRGAAAAAT